MTAPTRPPLSVARFAELLDTYGGALERWPVDDRVRAEALLLVDGEARGLQAVARELDVELDRFELAEPSNALRARVLEIPIRHAHHEHAAASGRLRGLRMLLIALVPCVLGFASGAYFSEANDSDDGWNEVTSVALLSDLGEEDGL
jgi:hypothetical protein